MAEKTVDLSQAKQMGLRRLGSRARSVAELRQYLLDQAVLEPVVDQVISRFIEVGLLDDAGFARAWVETRQISRSTSKSALRRELIEKGISEEIISNILAEIEPDDYEVAMGFALRRVKTMSGLDQLTVTRRLSAQLARRGFGSAVIRRTVEQVISQIGGEVGNIADDE